MDKEQYVVNKMEGMFMSNERYELLTKKPHIIQMSEIVNGHRIFMYRDDPEDFGFGGNKVRFFEYLIPQILAEKPDILVTTGSIYSNHIRVTAQVAAKLNIPCKLFLTEDTIPETLFGNAALAKRYGAELQCIGQFAVLVKVSEEIKALEESGKKVFLVPNGGHAPGAVRAYAGVVSNTLDELEKKNIFPTEIYLPCASGTTHAGVLCAGAKRSIPPVTAFAVANTTKKAERGITRLIQSAGEYLPQGFVPDNVSVQDCGKNDYGRPDEELLALRANILKQDGVQLDPVYNINAFYGMVQKLSQTPGTGDVLYINTGGYTELR